MVRQMSQLGMGILLATLLILGLSNKGTYGKVPVFSSSKKPARLDRAQLVPSSPSAINSLFVKSVKSAASNQTELIILVAYGAELVQRQARVGPPRIPLVLSVSTLPFQEATFDPTLLEFEQDGRRWRPGRDRADMQAFPAGSPFGGSIGDGEIHQGLVMLPAEFDAHRAIVIRYLQSTRVLRF